MAKNKIIQPFLYLEKDKYTVDTVAELQTRQEFIVGDVVTLLGYYEKGDGAGHQRMLSDTDDGSGIPVGDKFWNMIYDSDFNIQQLGVKKYLENLYKPSAYFGNMNWLGLINERFRNNIEIYRTTEGFKTELQISKFSTNTFRTVYIREGSVNQGNGNIIQNAITLETFKYKLDTNAFSDTHIRVMFLDSIYRLVDGITMNAGAKIVSYESMSVTGRTIITTGKIAYQYEEEVTALQGFKLINVSSKTGMVYDYTVLDNYNQPKPYKKANNLGEYNSNIGCFYIDPSQPTSVYIKPFNDIDRDKLKRNLIITTGDSNPINFEINTNGVNLFTNLDFVAHSSIAGSGCVNLSGNVISSLFLFNNCTSIGGNSDGFSFQGVYSCLLNNCISSYSGKDCFNYHTADKRSLAIEVNCIGYGAGKYKVPFGNQTTNSNNATTTHDGMTIYRFGSIGFDCEGGVLADVGDCTSINYDCEMGESTTPNGYKASYLFSGDYATPRSTAVMVNCKGGYVDNTFTIFTNRSIKLIIDKFSGDLKNGKTNLTPENTFIIEEA